VKCLFFRFASILLALAGASGAVLWKDPGPIEGLDLAGGPGGRNKAPVAPFTFLAEEKSGTSPKVMVRDARGAEWIVKFGQEVNPENFATRIVWAAGYFAVPTYFVRDGKIEGITKLGRAASFVDHEGTFQNARFAIRDEARRAARPWNLTDPALKGSRELAGLKVLAILLSNWDVKPENLSIVPVQGEAVYAVTDWGATMGRPAEIMGRSKWDCQSYAADSHHFTDGVDNGFVQFNYQGKQGYEILRGIRAEDVRWLMQRLGRLSDAQIESALQASGASAEEQSCFAPAFRSRLQQLLAVSEPSAEGHSINTYSRREKKTTTTRRER
jgi:hypothetical protein